MRRPAPVDERSGDLFARSRRNNDPLDYYYHYLLLFLLLLTRLLAARNRRQRVRRRMTVLENEKKKKKNIITRPFGSQLYYVLLHNCYGEGIRFCCFFFFVFIAFERRAIRPVVPDNRPIRQY